MRNRIPFDIYTTLIVAIVPVFLITAWGLTWNHERIAKKEGCENAVAFLTDATALAPAYADAGTLGNSDLWLSQVESITSPGAAKDVRDVVLSSITYGMGTDPELETTGTGEVYETLTPFRQSIDRARDELVEQCPDTATMIPDAFPMFFRTGAQ